MKNKHFQLLVFLFLFTGINVQVDENKYIPAEIDFVVNFSDWDSYGFNYVEKVKTGDYAAYP